MIINEKMGDRIRKHRELLGYTRENLSERLNVSTKFCADIELGNKGMSIETLCKLSKELFISTDYILFGNNNSALDEELTTLVKKCKKEHIPYLKNIIRNFIKACNDNE